MDDDREVIFEVTDEDKVALINARWEKVLEIYNFDEEPELEIWMKKIFARGYLNAMEDMVKIINAAVEADELMRGSKNGKS